MARFLPEAINSVAKNSFQDIELIIIDDGSTDNTAERIKEFETEVSLPIRYHHVSHSGKAGCINEVIANQKVNGKYIVFMDTDDILPNDSLKKRYEAIESSEAEMIIGEFAVTDLEGSIIEMRGLDRGELKVKLIQQFFFSVKTPFHLNSTIITKELLYKTGLFDESLMRGQEVDYSIRLLKTAARIEILPEVVYHYRKYYRPLSTRLVTRLQTMRHRRKTINKHLDGTQKAKAMMLHTLLDLTKLVYDLLYNYKY
jgi:glycosyltransferase involved in cell wall biosynthesis